MSKLVLAIRRWQVRILNHLPEYKLLRSQHDKLADLNRQYIREIAKLKLDLANSQSSFSDLHKLWEAQKSSAEQSLQARLKAEQHYENLLGQFDQCHKSHADEVLALKQQVDWWALLHNKRPVYGVAPVIIEPPKPPAPQVDPPPLTGRGAVRAATEQFIREADELLRKSASGQASMPSVESWSSASHSNS